MTPFQCCSSQLQLPLCPDPLELREEASRSRSRLPSRGKYFLETLGAQENGRVDRSRNVQASSRRQRRPTVGLDDNDNLPYQLWCDTSGHPSARRYRSSTRRRRWRVLQPAHAAAYWLVCTAAMWCMCSTPYCEGGRSWKHSRVECLHNLLAHRRIRLVWAEEAVDLPDHLLE